MHLCQVICQCTRFLTVIFSLFSPSDCESPLGGGHAFSVGHNVVRGAAYDLLALEV